MRRRIQFAVALLLGALAATATTATAAEQATWGYDGQDALVAGQSGTVEVSLSVDDPGFPADLPIGYRHFLLEFDPDDPSQTTPQTGLEVPWTRGGDSGTVTVDASGAFVLPDLPFRRQSTPNLGTTAGDRQTLELTLPAGDYVLFSDLVDLSSPTTRIEGPDRYATAAAASARFFPPDVDVVYVASGESFPDALAAGPAAAHREAPLLLTARDTLPQATRGELRRLSPDRIVLVGGQVAVAGSVARELRAYAGTVTRVAGDDRYATAARIARNAWGSSTVDTAYVASGEDFPDALGASARAALDDVPVLLVRGDAVPEVTGATLESLGVEAVTVAGGTGVVAPATARALEDHVGAVTRRAGPDRYATSAALADRPGSGRTLLVATGEAFPDGLTAASLARHLDADVLLTSSAATVPDVIADRAAELAPRRIYGLGGMNALSRSALRTLDQLRTPLTPIHLSPVLADGQGGGVTFTVEAG